MLLPYCSPRSLHARAFSNIWLISPRGNFVFFFSAHPATSFTDPCDQCRCCSSESLTILKYRQHELRQEPDKSMDRARVFPMATGTRGTPGVTVPTSQKAGHCLSDATLPFRKGVPKSYPNFYWLQSNGILGPWLVPPKTGCPLLRQPGTCSCGPTHT